MQNLEELKKAIADAIDDKELLSSLCCGIDAYARRWPFVLTVTDWSIWSEHQRALRLQVIRWLEDNGTPYNFWQFWDGWGLIGFENREAATHLTSRWSGQLPVSSRSSTEEWNPHPSNSTFKVIPSGEVAQKTATYARIVR